MTKEDRFSAAAFYDKLAEKTEKSLSAAAIRKDEKAIENLKKKLRYYRQAAEEFRRE